MGYSWLELGHDLGGCQTLFIRRREAFKRFKVKNILGKASAYCFVEKPYMEKVDAAGF